MANVQDRAPPTTAAIAISAAIVAGLAGYYLGQARSVGLIGKSSTRARPAATARDAESSDGGEDAEIDEDDDLQDLGALKTFRDTAEECKLVLVVRTDLGMGKGE
jgi:peptidyl-tRNA hydrolase, PTH2 family